MVFTDEDLHIYMLAKKINVNRKYQKIPAENFCGTLFANVDNKNLSDSDFRDFVKNTLEIVQFDLPKKDSE